MVSNIEAQSEINMEDDLEESNSPLTPTSPIPNCRPSSMVVKKANTMIPAHLVAEAISTLHGLDLRWSGPITPTEMQYVEQYVLAKYPQYCIGLVSEEKNNEQESSKSQNNIANKDSPPSFSINLSDLEKPRLEPSRLLDILTKKSSYQANFISIPEIQGRNRALKHCGLNENDYLILFMSNYQDAMLMIGESYPFFKGNYYMTIINQEPDPIKQLANQKESRVISAPETWLDLRIKGSLLSQYFRRKCKYNPKGLFSYPAVVNATRYSMHWISEAHRNSWHVLLDATGLVFGEERLNLALHRPDFVLCTLDNIHPQPSKITCLLVRKKSFDTSPIRT